MKKYDLIIIGSGAGLMVAQAAAQHDQTSCALVEAGPLGGTCLNRGCIPSKVLVHPADLVREAQHASRVGVHLSVNKIDWQTISRRVWQKINGSQKMEGYLREEANLDLYKAQASFIDEHTLLLENESGEQEKICGDKILIAAGARTFIPPIAGLADAGYITSETFFGDKYPDKPWDKLVIIGGGAIGCEFAHIFSAMGTKVTLVENLPRIAANEEPEISHLLQAQLEAGGVEVLTGVKATKVAAKDGRKYLTLLDEAGNATLHETEEIFISTGIRSNADRLNLEAAGVFTDVRGWIQTNEYLETNVPHIFALGDINGKFQFRHKANYEADLLIHNWFSGQKEKRSAHYTTVPWAIFTYPQIAHVGLTEEEALKTGKRIKVGKNYYSMTAGGYALGYEPGASDDGFVKLIADENSKILGVHIIGPHASILIQSFVYLMNAGFTCQSDDEQLPIPGQSGARFCLQPDSIDAIDQSMVIHPALSEVAAWVTGELEWIN